MSDRITKLQRWIDLIAFLVSRRLPVPYEELLRHVPAYGQKWDDEDATAQAAVRRMFERDKDELRKHGIPLQTVRYSINFGIEQIDGYAITRRDFYLPYLRLVALATEADPGRHSDQPRGRAPGGFRDPQRVPILEIAPDEAQLALDALRRVADVPAFPLAGEARSAFRKLAFDLEPDAFLADAPVLFVERPETSALLDRLRSLSNALLARKRITFRYHGIHRGESTDRNVEPYGMLFHHGHWYLAGHDRDRAAVRLFRTERMEDVRVNTRSPNSADFERPANFRLDDFAGREAWELGNEDEPTVNARILFRWPASLAAARNGLGSLVEERREGGAIRAFEIRQVPPFLRWLLSQEGDAVIVDPPELAEALASLARDVAAAHGRPPDGTEPNAVGTDGAHDHD